MYKVSEKRFKLRQEKADAEKEREAFSKDTPTL
jgi:hypothetical protein